MGKTENDGAPVKFPPPLVYLTMAVLGGLLDHFVQPLAVELPLTIQVMAIAVLTAPSIALIGNAIGLFKKTGQNPKPWKATPEIISTGIYGMTRNPMYVGMALIQAAIGIGLSNGWILILIPLSLCIVYLIAIRHEEAYLEKKFGQSYLDYKSTVRRWL